MKIALINTVNLEENGISTFILNNSYLFSEWGEQVSIIVPNKVKENLKRKIKARGIRLFELPMRSKFPKAYVRKLIKILKANKYDIVHVNGNSTTMAVELFAAWLAGIKVRIAHSHNTTTDHEKINKLLRPVFNLVVNGRIACNAAAGRWLFHQKKFLIIKNGIDLSHFQFEKNIRGIYRQKLNLGEKDILLGHVGRFNRQKNQIFLLNLMKQLEPNYYLILVGSGMYFEKLKRSVNNDTVLSKHVFFTGAISDTAGWLDAMDLFLLPSLYEGQPYTLIEATASGLNALVSSKISQENDLANNISFENLNSPIRWINEIESAIPIVEKRKNKSELYIKKLKNEGYDTVENAKILLNFYKEKSSYHN